MTTASEFRFQTIVVATDLSDTSLAALHYAQAVAHIHNSKVVITHVVDPVAYAFPQDAPKCISEDKVALGEWRQMEDEVVRRGIPVHSKVESEIICERILQSLQDNHADLLVLGTNAKTAAGRAALGTVARRLLARTICPMLVVSPECEIHLPSAGCWRRVLIATDFSFASLEALGYAHRVAYERLMVMHVEPCNEKDWQQSCLERLRFLAPFNESHTVPIEHIVSTGNPGRVIAEHANKFHADLVVLGSPDDELEEADCCSSTVLEVIAKANCPVLCVPSVLKTPARALVEEVAHAC